MPSSDAPRRPTAKGRPGASRPAAYRWQLSSLMDSRGLRASVELGPLLAERGVVLSDAQVYRLIHYVPERLSLKTLSALCDIFQCSPNDLIATYIEGSMPTATPQSSEASPPQLGRISRPMRPKPVADDEPEKPELPVDFAPVKADLRPTKRRRADRT